VIFFGKYLYMTHDLLLAWKSVIAVSITASPETLVDALSMTDMYLGDMRIELIFPRKYLMAAFPFANAREGKGFWGRIKLSRRRYLREGNPLEDESMNVMARVRDTNRGPMTTHRAVDWRFCN
jgi:hypothetical protein